MDFFFEWLQMFNDNLQIIYTQYSQIHWFGILFYTLTVEFSS